MQTGKTKNILIVSPYFYPEGGGLELYVFKIAKYFSKKDKVIVLCSTKKESKIENPSPNLRIIRERPNFFISNTPINLKLKHSIKSIIKEYNIDIINAHTPVPFYADIACYLARKNNIPFILSYHSSSLYKNRPFLDLIAFFYQTFFEKRLFKFSKKIILTSQYPLGRKLSEYKNKSIVIPPFVNSKLFRKPKLKRKKEILFVGQLNRSHEWKGLENLIKAFDLFRGRNKNYKLLIAGDGDYLGYYKNLVKKLNLGKEIKFLGQLNQKEIIKYYQKCAFVVIPSISNVEGTPTVLFEAMACGTPVIGGDVGGIPYVIKKDKCGLIVDAKRIKGLSKAMGALVNNKRLYNRLSKNCLENIKKYEKKVVLKKIGKVLGDSIEDKKTKSKKIAIFHNYMDNIGGAEMVCLTLARELNADFYTTNIDEGKIKKMGFSEIKLKSIGKVPINAPFRHQLALWRFRKLNLKNKYDFYIIGGDWAMSGAVNNKPNLWYIHSPTREIWDLYKYTRQRNVSLPLRPIFDIWVYCNRYLNKKYIQETNKMVCNSKNTQKRVKKYLNKKATVINPPIETSKFHYKKTGGYWLSVNRLFVHKRVDIQIKAFQKLLDERLIIVGSHEQSGHLKAYINYIKSIKPKNVEILSWVDFNKLVDLYANCKGLITTSKDEDFGMNVCEAAASGKPVIAPNEGGYKETVIDGITGKLIDDIDEYKLVEAIKEISKNPEKYKNACLKQAKKFDTKIFIKKIKEQIEK